MTKPLVERQAPGTTTAPAEDVAPGDPVRAARRHHSRSLCQVGGVDGCLLRSDHAIPLPEDFGARDAVGSGAERLVFRRDPPLLRSTCDAMRRAMQHPGEHGQLLPLMLREYQS